MNRREKLLIITLAAVIILLGGFKLLIEPQMLKIGKASEEYFQVESDLAAIEKNRSDAKKIEDENRNLLKDIQENQSAFFPELENDRIHTFFQGIATSVNVTYDSLSMTSKKITQVQEQKVVNTDTSYPAKKAAEEINQLYHSKTSGNTTANLNNTETVSADKQPADLIEMMTVSLQFKGTKDQGLLAVDRINGSGMMIRIVSLDMTTNANNQTVTSITAECFGVVKPQIIR